MSAVDGACWPDKACEEAVTGRVVLGSFPGSQGLAYGCMMAKQKFTPATVTQLGLFPG